jgi:hypothetical protein
MQSFPLPQLVYLLTWKYNFNDAWTHRATPQKTKTMSVDTAYAHIEIIEGDPAHLRRTPGVRVAQLAMDYLAFGWSVDEMCRQHAYLTPAEAHAAMAYYFDHQEEIDREIEAEVREAESTRSNAAPTAFVVRMKAKGLL